MAGKAVNHCSMANHNEIGPASSNFAPARISYRNLHRRLHPMCLLCLSILKDHSDVCMELSALLAIRDVLSFVFDMRFVPEFYKK